MEYKINVNCNTHDIALAIKEGMRPMQSFFDTTRDNLPFFANQIAPSDGFGNFHHPTFSAAHIPGRWLLALLNAESVTGISPDENAIKNLRKWAFATLTEVKIGFPACMDHEKGKFIKATDLHNLRETMHALFALCKWRKDEKAKELALGIIRSLDRYFDYNRGAFDIDKYYKETGAEIMYSCSHPLEGLLFPPHFGRYIGPLVKFWKATGENEALYQAIALKDVCFRDVLLEDGDYDAVIFGGHTHSTTAMISSLAQLGDAINDRDLRPHRRFLQKRTQKDRSPVRLVCGEQRTPRQSCRRDKQHFGYYGKLSYYGQTRLRRLLCNGRADTSRALFARTASRHLIYSRI